MTYSTTFEPSLWYDWWDSDYEDFRAIAELMGFCAPQMQFSGFCCQGDGASFTAHFEPRKGIYRAVRDYAPKDSTLHEIARRVAKLQRQNFYQLHADIARIGHHYVHENTIAADNVRREHPTHGDMNATPDADRALTEIARDLSRWLYRQLEREHDWQTMDQAGAHCGRIAAVARNRGRDYIATLRQYRAVVAERHDARRDDVPLSATRAWVHATAHRLRRQRQQWAEARADMHAALREYKPGRRGWDAHLIDAFNGGFSYGKEDY